MKIHSFKKIQNHQLLENIARISPNICSIVRNLGLLHLGPWINKVDVILS